MQRFFSGGFVAVVLAIGLFVTPPPAAAVTAQPPTIVGNATEVLGSAGLIGDPMDLLGPENGRVVQLLGSSPFAELLVDGLDPGNTVQIVAGDGDVTSSLTAVGFTVPNGFPLLPLVFSQELDLSAPLTQRFDGLRISVRLFGTVDAINVFSPGEHEVAQVPLPAGLWLMLFCISSLFAGKILGSLSNIRRRVSELLSPTPITT